MRFPTFRYASSAGTMRVLFLAGLAGGVEMIKTPYYLIDKQKLLSNMQKIAYVREQSGAKALLALKCFATWSVFDLMQQYMDGTTSSSLYELKLGRQKFQGETHAYSVAWADDEIQEMLDNCDKIIFNSIGQLQRFAEASSGKVRGLRVNPQVSSSDYLLADPARPFSRLGEWDPEKIERVSLGGGIHFTGEDYAIDAFCARLKAFSQKYGVQVYLEPGEAAITQSASLEVTVLDTLYNGKHLAVVDSSIEAHMLDMLIYRLNAKLAPSDGEHTYMVCGKSCLAGDIFGEYQFDRPLAIGDRLSFIDAAGYTMVKKNWFNGLKMPSIVVKQLDGSVEVVREFGYEDYLSSLS